MVVELMDVELNTQPDVMAVVLDGHAYGTQELVVAVAVLLLLHRLHL